MHNRRKRLQAVINQRGGNTILNTHTLTHTHMHTRHVHDVQKSDRQPPRGAHWVMLMSAVNVIFRKNVL